jgi:hypothetical protein
MVDLVSLGPRAARSQKPLAKPDLITLPAEHLGLAGSGRRGCHPAAFGFFSATPISALATLSRKLLCRSPNSLLALIVHSLFSVPLRVAMAGWGIRLRRWRQGGVSSSFAALGLQFQENYREAKFLGSSANSIP